MKQPVSYTEQRILIVVIPSPVQIVVVQNGTNSLGQIVIIICHCNILVVGQWYSGNVYLRHLGRPVLPSNTILAGPKLTTQLAKLFGWMKMPLALERSTLWLNISRQIVLASSCKCELYKLASPAEFKRHFPLYSNESSSNSLITLSIELRIIKLTEPTLSLLFT